MFDRECLSFLPDISYTCREVQYVLCSTHGNPNFSRARAWSLRARVSRCIRWNADLPRCDWSGQLCGGVARGAEEREAFGEDDAHRDAHEEGRMGALCGECGAEGLLAK